MPIRFLGRVLKGFVICGEFEVSHYLFPLSYLCKYQGMLKEISKIEYPWASLVNAQIWGTKTGLHGY